MLSSDPVALTTTMVCEATTGRVVAGDPMRVFNGVSTDTRAIVPGALFIALRGDRFDGHAFAAQAVSLGAAGVLVASPASDISEATVIVVPDTLVALQALARAVRRASGATVIAITGSAGKTTTKEVTADLLSLRYRVFRNQGNLNNHVGLPLSLLELRHRPELAVVELGMNHAGEIRALVAIAEPDVRVWTNVGDAHIGYFGSREAVARAKAEMLEHAGPGTLVIANADDALVMAHVATFAGRRLTFGEAGSADVRATSIVDRGFDGTSADVRTPAGVVSLNIPLPGRPAPVERPRGRGRRRGVRRAARGPCRPRRDAARRAASRSLGRGTSPSARRRRFVQRESGRRARHPGDARRDGDHWASRGGVGRDARTGQRGARPPRSLWASCGGIGHRCPRRDRGRGGGSVGRRRPGGRDGRGPGASVCDQCRRRGDRSRAWCGPGDVVLVKGSRGTRTDLVADRLLEVA